MLQFSGCAYHHKRTDTDLIKFGIELAEKGYWHEAAIQWRMVLNEDPSNVAALNNLGIAAEVDGQPQEARKLLMAALQHRPDDLQIKRNIVSVKEREDKENTRETDDEKDS